MEFDPADPRSEPRKLVKDLVKAGDVQREHAQERVEELLERSRATTRGARGASCAARSTSSCALRRKSSSRRRGAKAAAKHRGSEAGRSDGRPRRPSDREEAAARRRRPAASATKASGARRSRRRGEEDGRQRRPRRRRQARVLTARRRLDNELVRRGLAASRGRPPGDRRRRSCDGAAVRWPTSQPAWWPLGEPIVIARAPGSVRGSRRREARRGTGRVRHRRDGQARAIDVGCLDRRVHRLPAATRRGERGRASTSATVSSTHDCETTRGSPSVERTNVTGSIAGRARRPLRRRGRRSLVHLAGPAGPGVVGRARRRRRRPRRAGEAAVRGWAGRSPHGARGDP